MATDRPARNASQPRNRGSRRSTVSDEVLNSGFEEGTLDNTMDDEFSTDQYSSAAANASPGGSNGSGDLAGDAESLKETARKATSGFVQQARQQAVSQINAQKDRAAESLSSVAHAIRQTGDQLRGENEFVASYVDTAVNQLQHLSDRLRDKAPEEFVRDLEDFARRSPGAFLGGAFILGVGLARFLRSSSEERQVDYGGRQPIRSPSRELSGSNTANWQTEGDLSAL